MHQAPPASVAPQKRKRSQGEFARNIDHDTRKKPKMARRANQRDARSLASQTSSKALKGGELDVEKFIKAREYEIQALEDGLSRSKKAQNRRAHQQVPRDLRRRTASHNVKRVPKRLRAQGRHEMAVDNTPTVTARKRKPTRHMRLRIEAVRKLRALGAQKKRALPMTEARSPRDINGDHQVRSKTDTTRRLDTTRSPKIKSTALANPPLPKAKYRKRQKHKSWLPTHIFHAKRAHMTPPKEPLWRFAVPLSPTAKCYRPTHRAVNERGAVAWDNSYFATLLLKGRQRSLESVLKGLRVEYAMDNKDSGPQKKLKWQRGTRIWQGLAYEHEEPYLPIAPITLIWSAIEQNPELVGRSDPENRIRNILVRVHPSAFLQLWTQLVCLAKVVKPQVTLEDLRYEIGSIEVTGPGATEALLGALWPCESKSVGRLHATGSVEHSWKILAGLTNLALLPENVLLGFDVEDPRLHHPPRTIHVPTTPEQHESLLNLLANWPIDDTQDCANIFSRQARLAASSSLPSQKSLNRRKTLATPGEYPVASAADPKIPVMLYTTLDFKKRQRKWTLLLPWKCVQPVWYSLMYYPLSTGMQPRFGGLNQQRQLAFENGVPWFPGDYPGTQAGWQWELAERQKRKEAWSRKPKSKRVNWDALDLGGLKKGEIGQGWACAWEALVLDGLPQAPNASGHDVESQATKTKLQQSEHVPFVQVIHGSVHSSGVDAPNGLITVRITLLARGLPEACARIYRLPAVGSLRETWLALQPGVQASRRPSVTNGNSRKLLDDASSHHVHRRLAQSLLRPPQAGDIAYPVCPGEEDLIGFVTTGNFNLSEGQGTGIGSVLLSKLSADMKHERPVDELCVIRNAGKDIGRLAKLTRI